MKTLLRARLFLLAAATLLGGCTHQPTARVVSRSVSAVAAGGPQEVWVVMSETGAQFRDRKGYVDREAYALYHCVPQGCKRVSELTGTEVTVR